MRPSPESGELDFEEVFTRVALVVAVIYGERGRCDPPTVDQVLNLSIAAHDAECLMRYKRKDGRRDR